VVSLKFVEEVQTVAAVEVEFKSPCSPPFSIFFKGGSSPWAHNPSLGNFGKEGKGRFF
jgi:hypothetical protein